MERDKFDNKTVTFEEHIKEEHNMWHYLCFIVLVKVKDSTEYTGPESYVAEMIKVSLQFCFGFFSPLDQPTGAFGKCNALHFIYFVSKYLDFFYNNKFNPMPFLLETSSKDVLKLYLAG